MTDLSKLTEDQLLTHLASILAHPGPITGRDEEEMAVINNEYIRRQRELNRGGAW